MAWHFFMQNVLFNPFQVNGHNQKWIYLNYIIHLRIQSPCIFPKLRFSPKQQNIPWVSPTPPTPDAFSSSPLPSWIVVATDRPPINKYLDWGGNNTGGKRGGGGRRYILHCITYVTGAGSLPFTPLFRSIRSFALPHTTYIPCLKHSSSVRAKKSALTNLGAFLSTGGKWEIRVLCSAVPLRSWKNEPCSVVSGFGRGGGRSTTQRQKKGMSTKVHSPSCKRLQIWMYIWAQYQTWGSAHQAHKTNFSTCPTHLSGSSQTFLLPLLLFRVVERGGGKNATKVLNYSP